MYKCCCDETTHDAKAHAHIAAAVCMQAPDGRGLVNADYINEDSKRATVTVTGHINQVTHRTR